MSSFAQVGLSNRSAEIVEAEPLVCTWGGEDDQPALITVTFADHDGGTRLTLHLVGLAELVTGVDGIEDWWRECLESLDVFLARRVPSGGQYVDQ